MDAAYVYAGLSSCERKKVGCVIVKDDRIISIGYNGSLPGHDNRCEEEVKIEPRENFWEYLIEIGEAFEKGCIAREDGIYAFKTKPDIIHAERNAITKLAKSHESGGGASLFVTLAPCKDCATLIIQSGIKEVYFREEYRDMGGVELLEQVGIKVEQL